MAANTNPVFTLTPVIGQVQIATANTNRDGTGTIGDAVTGAADGTRVEWVQIKATGTTTAGMVRLFLYDGSAYKLFDEVPVSAITPSATVAAFSYAYVFSKPIVLPSGKKLSFSTEKAETFTIAAFGGSLS